MLARISTHRYVDVVCVIQSPYCLAAAAAAVHLFVTFAPSPSHCSHLRSQSYVCASVRACMYSCLHVCTPSSCGSVWKYSVPSCVYVCVCVCGRVGWIDSLK